MHARVGVSRATTAVVAAVVAGSVVAGCSPAEDQIPSIGYGIDNVLTTYNARTVDGAASGARQAFPRVQTGFAYLGPEGEALADNDIGSATVVPAESLTVRYVIAPQAVYSDGVPMTCDDLVLTWASNSGRFVAGENDLPLFDAASTAGYRDIDTVDCTAGSKEATVTFRAGRSYTDWRSLFGATDILPAHVAARVTGIPDVVAPIAAGDLDTVRRIADFWNTGWSLVPGAIDTSLLPSNGPYRVDSYTSDGGLVLVANDKWWGIAPATERIIVWPKGTDVPARGDSGELEVADQGAGAAVPGEGFERTDFPSKGIEQLTFATSGTLAPSAVRRALALCSPRAQLFDEYGHPGFDESSGTGSAVVDSRLVQPDTLLYPPVAATAAGRFLQPDIVTATAELAGAGVSNPTVRIGYLAPDARRSEIVADIAAACGPAGIIVQDAGSPDFEPSALRTGSVDAILGSTASAPGAAGSVSDASAHDSLHSRTGNNVGGYTNTRIDAIVDQLAVETSDATQLAIATEGENVLWNDMPSLPLFNSPRTVVAAEGMDNVVVNPTAAGSGWNMDRWILLR
ncbi:ABC transporter substrate-binding protein [Rhodococcoides yunnanense]|uniref:ABC transporter substrate-binding protein n=1 Tax=Rhodococcoides yunnanense TaxID=278209 RepID=UPI0009353F66|nr:ABC transporter substrate-binding protein [Rhodococcus yunnanensis]